MADAEAPAKKSDLGVRTVSALVMVGVAGTALWLGGWGWAAFVALVALGVLWEFARLAFALSNTMPARATWAVAGLVYISVAAAVLLELRAPFDGIFRVSLLLLAVIGVDVGAYFAGRAIGGPKIAPKISPSKTWAGLAGGAIGGGLVMFVVSWAWPAGLCRAYVNLIEADLKPLPYGVFRFDDRCHLAVPTIGSLWVFIMAGALVAIVAQSGDFFESWMKRRAGVKDSSKLIPGHGGLFDRADGLLAVCFVLGLLSLHSLVWSE